MLKIFNDLEPFFRDNYRRINVREYARLKGITPPTASKLLGELQKDYLLKKEAEKNYIYYSANRDNAVFVSLSRGYWHAKLVESGVITYLEKELLDPLVVLFGSFSKGEIKHDSDIDLAVFSISPKKTLRHIDDFGRKIRRKIHIFTFKGEDEVKSKELLNNIRNGLVICGGWN